MPTDFAVIRKLYNDNQFVQLLRHPNGIYWLKMRSISRTEQMHLFCQRAGIATEGINGRQLFEYVYNMGPDQQALDEFIRGLFQTERAERRQNEDYLISQLYQMKVFDWGGLYQNSLEQTIVDNYVKKIQSWETLNSAVENEIHVSMKGYVQCSWYNHWSSIIIEDIFKDHPAVLPAMGLIKKVDFFIHNFPFDLKVTYFPEGYMHLLRRVEGLRPELTLLKAICRQQGIWFDNNQPADVLFPELFAKVVEHQSDAAQEFIQEFKQIRMHLLQQTIENPQALKIWLYENQGVRRFDAANRFFLVLVDAENFDESWKLKRNKDLLISKIHSHLDTMRPEDMENLRLEFEWGNDHYETYADILFVVVNQQ